jgi:hypothetical protein
MNTNKSFAAVATLAAFLGTSLLTPLAARASEEGKRNTTLGLGAASAALLLTQKNKLPGALLGAGAIYSGIQYNNAINARHKRERQQAYRTGYRRGDRSARLHRTHHARHHE